MSFKSRTGGEHGGVYTKPFDLEFTLSPLINELLAGRGELIPNARYVLKKLGTMVEGGLTPELLKRWRTPLNSGSRGWTDGNFKDMEFIDLCEEVLMLNFVKHENDLNSQATRIGNRLGARRHVSFGNGVYNLLYYVKIWESRELNNVREDLNAKS